MNAATLHRFSPLPLVMALMLLTGCGGSDRKVTVSGNVTLDSKPVEKATIVFAPQDGRSTPAAGPIVDGHYELKNVALGPNKVQVVFNDQPQESTLDAKEGRKNRGREARQFKEEQKKHAPARKMVGNGQVHDIKDDSTSLDIELKTSTGR